MLAAAVSAVVCVAMPAAAAGRVAAASRSDPSGAARSQLVSLLDNVRGATGHSYQTRDSTGDTVDTMKIIQVGASRYVGVYHVNEDGFFSVRAAMSSDLVHWQFVSVLEPNASQPTIAELSDGNFLVAYEKRDGRHTSHLEFRIYPDILGLRLPLSTGRFDAPRTLSSIAEGTPNLHDTAMNPILGLSTIHVGFHYFNTGLGEDRNARGTLTNFTSWRTQVATDLNGALPVSGNVGARDSINFGGYPFTLIEAQVIARDWSSWRTYLFDETAKTRTLVQPQTTAGSYAFANPKAPTIIDPAGHRALVATMFIPSQGAAGDEAGPLVYWNEY